MMLIRSSLPSNNPLTLPDTVHLLSEAESKTEKSEIFPILKGQMSKRPPQLWGSLPGTFKGRSRFVHEHSAENLIFGRIWDGRPGIETENASNRSSLVIEIYVTPF